MSAGRLPQLRPEQGERGAIAASPERESGAPELAPGLARLSAAPAPPPLGRGLGRAAMLRMQRQVGNGQVARALAQRSPQATAPQAALPQPAADPVANPQAQALADRIRQDFAQGVVVALSIPEAFASREEADRSPRDSVSGYAWRTAWANLFETSAATMQEFWHAHRPASSPLPEQLGTATAPQRNVIRNWLWTSAQVEAKDWLWANRQTSVTGIEYGNNREIPSQAAQFASGHNALAIGGSAGLTLGRHMTYTTSAEIAQHVNGVHEALLALLRANPGAAGSPPPEQAARIRFLALFAHGAIWNSGVSLTMRLLLKSGVMVNHFFDWLQGKL